MFAFLQQHVKRWSELSPTEDSDFRGLSNAVSGFQGLMRLELRYGAGAGIREITYWRTLMQWVALKVSQTFKIMVRGDLLEAPVIFYEGERWPLFLKGSWGYSQSPETLGVGSMVTGLGVSSDVEALKTQLSALESSHVGLYRDAQVAELKGQIALEELVTLEMEVLENLWSQL